MLAPKIAKHIADYPWVMEPVDHLSKGRRVVKETVVETLIELHNAAQLDVLGRASVIANERPNADR